MFYGEICPLVLPKNFMCSSLYILLDHSGFHSCVIYSIAFLQVILIVNDHRALVSDLYEHIHIVYQVSTLMNCKLIQKPPFGEQDHLKNQCSAMHVDQDGELGGL